MAKQAQINVPYNPIIYNICNMQSPYIELSNIGNNHTFLNDVYYQDPGNLTNWPTSVGLRDEGLL